VDHGTCDSCGEVDCDDLLALHRLYVTPEAWDTEGKVTRVDDVERWCAACRTHYPHVPVGADGDAPGAG
jgi:hypothetical protein